jgi:exoribonuclease II|nr:MAG TPA: tax1-binding protein [Bacteriophage sp.]
MNMCKFCNNKAKPIILNVEQDGIMNEKIQVFQATIKGNELMFEIVSNHLLDYFNLTTLKKQISYCPMCGKKLSED